jgi:hypothetical protein
MWFATDAETLLVIMDGQSLKARHLRNDPRIAAMILAPHEHSRYPNVHGTARERSALDIQAVYRRIVWKYERRTPDTPTTLILVELLPSQVRGFDYRDPPAAGTTGQ